MFEGEYLNGKKSVNGKEYDEKGRLIIEAIYLNNERTKILHKLKNERVYDSDIENEDEDEVVEDENNSDDYYEW